MLICLEGVDCAGKTTLAHVLASRLTDPRTISFHDTNGYSLEDHEARLDKYRPGTGDHLISDRYHWSEEIYGSLYRDGSNLNAPAGIWHIDAYLQSRGGVMVLVEADAKTQLERLRVRGDDFLQDEDVSHVFNAYRRLEASSWCSPITVPSPTPDPVVDAILKIGFLAEENVEPLTPWPMYVGPRDPSLVLVGVDPKGFLPNPGTSAEYLINNVVLKQSDPSSVGLLANTFDEGFEDLHNLYLTLGKPRIVALGREANGSLRGYGVPHGVVPHPNWWMTKGVKKDGPERYLARVQEEIDKLNDWPGSVA